MSTTSPAHSQPGTPSHSRDASPIITPRTKIRLLLEDSSDSDVFISAKPSRSVHKTRKPSPSKPAHTPSSPPLFLGDASSDIEMADTAPREGTLAARMRGLKPTKKPSPPPAPRPNIFGGNDSSDADDSEAAHPVPPRRKRRSPTPRKSPASPQAQRQYQDSSDSEDIPALSTKSERFKELLAKAQKERQAKEAAEKEKAELRREVEEMEIHSDAEEGKKRPARRAGKKAIEEIHRETQRLARNMQLAHEARSRTKITKSSLFEKFGFRPEGMEEEVKQPVRQPVQELVEVEMEDVREEEKSGSDIEGLFDKLISAAKKPASSPKVDKGKGKDVGKLAGSPVKPKVDKGKGRAISPPPPDKPERPLRIHLPARALVNNSDDSDLEIIDPEREKENEKARAAAEKQRLIDSLVRERKYTSKIRLSPKKKGPVTAKQLHGKLQAASRRQAVEERQERIEELRAQGIHVPTAEEREKEMAEVENLVEKARLEALRIKKLERRRDKLEKGENVDDDDDEQDGDWLDEGEVPEEEGLGEYDDEDEGTFLDGEAEDTEKSEDEEGGDVNMEDAGEDKEPASPTFSLSSLKDRQISPTPRLSDIPAVLEDDGSDDGGFAPLKRKPRRGRVIDDDDEDEAEETTPKAKKSDVSTVPDIFKNFAAPSMGMTQLFAGSAGTPDEAIGTIRSKADLLRQVPEDTIPNSQAPIQDDESQDLVPDSQVGGMVDLSYSQSQVEYQVLAAQDDTQIMSTQDMPEPTQDQGLTLSSSPMPPRFSSTSPPPTAPTQIREEPYSPMQKKRGRLSRRQRDFSDSEHSDPDMVSESEAEEEADKNAFKIMKQAAKKRKTVSTFDKKKSDAKGLVDEQASESEDEYKGIGGASGDEASDNDEYDAEIRAMLNDTNDEVLDEDLLAAYAAKRAVADDEKNVSKLFRDLQSGLLRKKRGAGAADLDDSDDEYAEIERKRRMKKRQMAAIRALLTQDQTLERIAKDPKKAAFFKSLEGDASDVDDDFLDREEENPFADTQDTDTQPTDILPDSQSAETSQQNTNPRRTTRTKKPGLADIRQTLSFLNEDKSALAEHSDSDSDTPHIPHKPQRTHAVIDRTSQSRNVSTSGQTKLAFGKEASGFRVPTLLHRSSTAMSGGSTVSSGGSFGTERSLGEKGMKKGGGKSKAVNSFRKVGKVVVEEGERKRKREREEEARRRRGVGIGGGSFE